jgi:broad specificity phosphatase PhoE
MERKIILIRHGETDWNSIYRIQGWIDTPLNNKGLSDSEKLADFLKTKNKTIDCLYSSDLKRAYMTAEKISKAFNKSISINTGLREQKLGEFEGKILTKLSHIQRKEFFNMKSSISSKIIKRYNNYETYLLFKERIFKTFYDIINQTQYKPIIIIVTHGGVIKLIAKEIIKINDEDDFYSIKNTSVTELLVNGKGIDLVLFNDNSFL